jgi:NitT/TauT family transport system ATP-binding protein
VRCARHRLVRVENVSHRFASRDARGLGIAVLENVNLAVADGTFISLLGPSGCGKTTLLRIIDGLIRPTVGQVLIDGRPVAGPARERAMVFQEFNLLPWRTVLGNIEFGLEVQGAPVLERRSRAEQTIRMVGLEGFESHFPHELSGGMKQRVGLARALSTTPQLLLMDEPFGALDPQIRELMQAELLKLWESERKTVLFVTHSIEEAILLSDQVAIFTGRPGRIREVIDIELARPRGGEEEGLRTSSRFLEYRNHIWQRLRPNIALN